MDAHARRHDDGEPEPPRRTHRRHRLEGVPSTRDYLAGNPVSAGLLATLVRPHRPLVGVALWLGLAVVAWEVAVLTGGSLAVGAGVAAFVCVLVALRHAAGAVREQAEQRRTDRIARRLLGEAFGG